MHPLKKGCFCCPLRSCVLIQGWVYSVTTTLVVLLTLSMFAFLDNIYYNKGDPTEERKVIWSLGTAVLYIIFVLVFMCAGIQYTMLVGIYKGRAWMLVPHLVLTALTTLGVSIFILVNKQTGESAVLLVDFFICVQAYFWFHVLSYYLELKRKTLSISPV